MVSLVLVAQLRLSGDKMTRCADNYLPWLLAYDFNFLPDADCKHELEDLGDDKFMVFLASHTINSKCLFIYDQDWEA